MYGRPDDERRRTPGRTPGVLVTCPRGKFFFPGGTSEAALLLARAALSGGDLTSPATRVEFGTAEGTTWECETKIKVPSVAEPAPPPDPAQMGWG